VDKTDNHYESDKRYISIHFIIYPYKSGAPDNSCISVIYGHTWTIITNRTYLLVPDNLHKTDICISTWTIFIFQTIANEVVYIPIYPAFVTIHTKRTFMDKCIYTMHIGHMRMHQTIQAIITYPHICMHTRTIITFQTI